MRLVALDRDVEVLGPEDRARRRRRRRRSAPPRRSPRSSARICGGAGVDLERRVGQRARRVVQADEVRGVEQRGDRVVSRRRRRPPARAPSRRIPTQPPSGSSGVPNPPGRTAARSRCPSPACATARSPARRARGARGGWSRAWVSVRQPCPHPAGAAPRRAVRASHSSRDGSRPARAPSPRRPCARGGGRRRGPSGRISTCSENAGQLARAERARVRRGLVRLRPSDVVPLRLHQPAHPRARVRVAR